MSVKKHIPNLLTLCNAACGFLGVVAILEGSAFHAAAFFMMLGLTFDFLDGMMARLLDVSGELGKQLDSLADVITFGILPGSVVYVMLDGHPLAWAAVLIPVLSVLRLAKFNLDTRQTENFIGLAVPAHAIFWMGYALVSSQMVEQGRDSFLLDPMLVAGLVLVTSSLTVSELPMFSLKFKNFSWAANRIRFIFLGLSIGVSLALVLLTDFLFSPLPIVILLYLLLSIINNLLPQQNEVQSRN